MIYSRKLRNEDKLRSIIEVEKIKYRSTVDCHPPHCYFSPALPFTFLLPLIGLSEQVLHPRVTGVRPLTVSHSLLYTFYKCMYFDFVE